MSIEHPCTLSTCPPMEANTAVFQYSFSLDSVILLFSLCQGPRRLWNHLVGRRRRNIERVRLAASIFKRLSCRFLSGNNYEDPRRRKLFFGPVATGIPPSLLPPRSLTARVSACILYENATRECDIFVPLNILLPRWEKERRQKLNSTASRKRNRPDAE